MDKVTAALSIAKTWVSEHKKVSTIVAAILVGVVLAKIL